MIIDPLEFLNVSHFIDTQTKVKVLNRNDESSPRCNMLWNVIHFTREPCENILIGDSQCREIKESDLQKFSGKRWFNFSVPGASYETMFYNFWTATKYSKLKEVYFNVSFMNFNANREYSITYFAEDYLDKPYLYFTKKETFFDSFVNLLYVITKDEDMITKPYVAMRVEDNNALAPSKLDIFFKNYEYPEDIYFELKRISDYCNQNQIKLVFLIMPSYQGVREYLQQKDLLPMYNRFKEDVNSLAYTIDFDRPGSISSDRSAFYDYFHIKEPVLEKLTEEIWGNKKKGEIRFN